MSYNKMSDSSSDEDKSTPLPTPRSARSNRRASRISCASGTSNVVIGHISEDVLQVWYSLPEAIRLDPSLDVFQREYDRVRALSDGTGKTDFTIVNMTLKHEIIHEEPSMSEHSSHDHGHEKFNTHERKLGPVARNIKLILMLAVWVLCFLALMLTSEKVQTSHQISVQKNVTSNMTLNDGIFKDRIAISIEGAFQPIVSKNVNMTLSPYFLRVWLDLVDKQNKSFGNSTEPSHKRITEIWSLPLLPAELADVIPSQKRTKTFHISHSYIDDYFGDQYEHSSIVMNLCSDLNETIPFTILYDVSPINAEDGIAYGAIVLVGLYVLIVFEIVHRTIAAMLAATASLAIMALMNEKPTTNEVMAWVDVDTLLLLFSMMILVAIVADTGVFDYLAVYAYKITKGEIWPLVSTLCFFTAFISSFLDNVTTVLLMTPVTIRLCEVTELNPVPVLTSMVIFSNIGGAMTPVGDPPNVIIASNREVVSAGVGFGTFTAHMSIGVFLVLAVVYCYFRYIFRDLSVLQFDEPQEVQELRHEITIWQRAAASLSIYSKDENVVRQTLEKKIGHLFKELRVKMNTESETTESLSTEYKHHLQELEEKYPIRNKWLLVKSGFSMILVITLFFLHSLPNFNLSLGWTAFLCTLLLLIVADDEDLDGLMARVEWSTLLFFAALFVLMEALNHLGLIAWIGERTELVIKSVSEESRLAVAILLLLWVSAIAGAFVDNVPLTTMMIRIATRLADNEELRLPLQPLVWALAFGACMGGNGTLIGATANVVCAGVAEQHGYRFTFMEFFKVGFPVLLSSTLTITVYLMVSHVIFDWNY